MTVGSGLFCQEKHCRAQAVTARTVDRAGGENTWVFGLCRPHADDLDNGAEPLVEREAGEKPVLVLDG